MRASPEDKKLLSQNKLKKLLETVDTKQLEIAQWLLEHSDYEEKPVSIEEFVNSPYYLNLKKYIRPRILEELINVFDSGKHYNEAIFVGSIGCGKSFLASICLVRLVYELFCLKNPQDYYRLAPGSAIHLMMMSVNEIQARHVIFSEIKARVDNSPWFRNRCFYDPNITSELRFPKNIYIIPGNSSETFFEGYNIFGGVLDEADSHLRILKGGEIIKDFAELGYDAIKGRIKSRFHNKGLLTIIGSAKREGGFLLTKYREAEKYKNIYRTMIRIWESPPMGLKFCGKTFKIKGDLDVPIEYKEEYDRNPEKFMRDYACIPMYATQPFFSFPEKVEQNFNPHRESPLTQFGQLERDFKATHDKPCWCHIDLGVKHDSCGLTIGSIAGWTEFEGEKLPKIRIDLMRQVKVPKGGEILIADIRQIVYNLIERGFKIVGVSMDGFQSTDSLQNFKKRGLKAELFSVDKDTFAYESLKETIYQNRLDYYYYEPFIQESVQLEYINGEKIDHPEGGSKDTSDSVAAVTYILSTDRSLQRTMTNFSPSLGGEKATALVYDTFKQEIEEHKVNF